MPTMTDYKTFLADVRKRTGLDAFTPDDSGLVSVRVQDEYNVNLQFVAPSGKILCFVEVADLPKDAGREIYRDLLAGGLFGAETAGGYFALATDTETVVYNYLFDFDPVATDPEVFIETLEKIIQLCDMWAERIVATIADDKITADEAPGSGSPMRLDP